MKPMKILIVDDDPDFAEGFKAMLELEGHSITLAADGEEALREFRAASFDITFLDVMLPGMNGVEVLGEIRRENAEARVIMMTGYSVDHLLKKAVEGGATRVLDKPLEAGDVLRAIEEVRPEGIVLIADDDADFVASIEEVLLSRGFSVLTARTGSEALDRAMAPGVDLLILDLRLPIMHGLEVYLELKRRKRCLPTIIVTGYPDEEGENIGALRSMEVAGCLFKPFDPEKLFQAIDSIDRSCGE